MQQLPSKSLEKGRSPVRNQIASMLSSPPAAAAAAASHGNKSSLLLLRASASPKDVSLAATRIDPSLRVLSQNFMNPPSGVTQIALGSSSSSYLAQVQQNYQTYHQQTHHEHPPPPPPPAAASNHDQYAAVEEELQTEESSEGEDSQQKQVESFKREIERRFQCSSVNQLYKFPVDSAISTPDSEASLLSLQAVRDYDLHKQNVQTHVQVNPSADFRRQGQRERNPQHQQQEHHHQQQQNHHQQQQNHLQQQQPNHHIQQQQYRQQQQLQIQDQQQSRDNNLRPMDNLEGGSRTLARQYSQLDIHKQRNATTVTQQLKQQSQEQVSRLYSQLHTILKQQKQLAGDQHRTHVNQPPPPSSGPVTAPSQNNLLAKLTKISESIEAESRKVHEHIMSNDNHRNNNNPSYYPKKLTRGEQEEEEEYHPSNSTSQPALSQHQKISNSPHKTPPPPQLNLTSIIAEQQHHHQLEATRSGLSQYHYHPQSLVSKSLELQKAVNQSASKLSTIISGLEKNSSSSSAKPLASILQPLPINSQQPQALINYKEFRVQHEAEKARAKLVVQTKPTTTSSRDSSNGGGSHTSAKQINKTTMSKSSSSSRFTHTNVQPPQAQLPQSSIGTTAAGRIQRLNSSSSTSQSNGCSIQSSKLPSHTSGSTHHAAAIPDYSVKQDSTISQASRYSNPKSNLRELRTKLDPSRQLEPSNLSAMSATSMTASKNSHHYLLNNTGSSNNNSMFVKRPVNASSASQIITKMDQRASHQISKIPHQEEAKTTATSSSIHHAVSRLTHNSDDVKPSYINTTTAAVSKKNTAITSSTAAAINRSANSFSATKKAVNNSTNKQCLNATQQIQWTSDNAQHGYLENDNLHLLHNGQRDISSSAGTIHQTRGNNNATAAAAAIVQVKASAISSKQLFLQSLLQSPRLEQPPPQPSKKNEQDSHSTSRERRVLSKPLLSSSNQQLQQQQQSTLKRTPSKGRENDNSTSAERASFIKLTKSPPPPPSSHQPIDMSKSTNLLKQQQHGESDVSQYKLPSSHLNHDRTIPASQFMSPPQSRLQMLKPPPTSNGSSESAASSTQATHNSQSFSSITSQNARQTKNTNISMTTFSSKGNLLPLNDRQQQTRLITATSKSPPQPHQVVTKQNSQLLLHSEPSRFHEYKHQHQAQLPTQYFRPSTYIMESPKGEQQSQIQQNSFSKRWGDLGKKQPLNQLSQNNLLQ